MKFFAAVAALAAACSIVEARPLSARETSKTFGVLAIRSGTDLQYASFYTSDGTIKVGGTEDVSFVIKNDVLYVAGTNDIVYVDPKTRQVKYGVSPPSGAITKTWSLGSVDLLLDGDVYATVCGSSGDYSLYWGSASKYTGLCPDGSDGQGIDTYVAYTTTSSSSKTSSTKTTATATPKPKALAAEAAAPTVTVLPPNLIVPAKEASPTSPLHSQYTGTVSSVKSSNAISYISFDVPQLKSKAKACKLIWTPPSKGSLPHHFAGEKSFSIYKIKSPIDENTLTWAKHPARGDKVATFDATKADSAAVSCSWGQKEQFVLLPVGSNDEVNWFQTNNPLTGINFVVTD
ncbi:ubiquitin 3 binding protein But2 C-terminal domain-containing protein [Lipomyces oligophaga]|uniref:ubiquitin 3 binding protein But2 C-terminal domain-containing protein n=1 Tax=Lipomyces oligophaga TaxID=45792 RepID=UPI0034CFC838